MTFNCRMRFKYTSSDLPADHLCRSACSRCGRQGAYRRETLTARFDHEIARDDMRPTGLDGGAYAATAESASRCYASATQWAILLGMFRRILLSRATQ